MPLIKLGFKSVASEDKTKTKVKALTLVLNLNLFKMIASSKNKKIRTNPVMKNM